MPRPNLGADAEVAFQEATKLVSEVRQSRQKSSALRVLEYLHADDKHMSAMPFVDVAHTSRNASLSAIPCCQGCHQSTSITSAKLITNTGENKVLSPDFSLEGMLLRACPHLPTAGDTRLGGGISPQLGSPSLNGATDLDTETTGDDQLSRWQLLTRRVNTNSAAAEPILSPPTKSAHSPDVCLPSSVRTRSPVSVRIGSGSGSAVALYDSPAARQQGSEFLGTTSALIAGVNTSRDQYVKATVHRSPSSALSPNSNANRLHANVADACTKWLAVPSGALSSEGDAAAVTQPHLCGGLPGPSRYPASGLAGGRCAFASPFERAAAALQQAEQQLREHKQNRTYGGREGGGSGPAVSPASATLEAAERCLALRPAPGPHAVPRSATIYGNPHWTPRHDTVLEPGATTDANSFDDVARGLIHRLTTSVRLGLGPPGAVAPSGPLLRSFTMLEPPPPQHVAAAAALAAAAASTGSGGSSSAGLEVDTNIELDLQIALQGLMEGARQASSGKALMVEQERRRQEAEDAAAAAIEGMEERAAQLARTVLYLRLWRMAGQWSRRETDQRVAELQATRMRRRFAAWRSAVKAARTERLAADAVELAAEVRREQVATRFRRLWLLHYSLAAWRRAAAAFAEEHRREAVRAEKQNDDKQMDVLRGATADRFRLLWLLHTHLRTWRVAARAQATARRVAGGGRGGGAAFTSNNCCRQTAMCGEYPKQPRDKQQPMQEQEQRRRSAVAALLDRLRSQRAAFHDAESSTGGCGGDADALHYGVHGSNTRLALPPPPLPPPPPPPLETQSAAPTGSNTSAFPPTAAGRSFPGLNKWIRPEAMRGRRSASVGASDAIAQKQPAATAAASVVARTGTVTAPFQLSTAARARYRRTQVLGACDATRCLLSEMTTAGTVRDTTDPWVGPAVAQNAAAFEVFVGAVGSSLGRAEGDGRDAARVALRGMAERRRRERRQLQGSAAVDDWQGRNGGRELYSIPGKEASSENRQVQAGLCGVGGNRIQQRSQEQSQQQQQPYQQRQLASPIAMNVDEALAVGDDDAEVVVAASTVTAGVLRQECGRAPHLTPTSPVSSCWSSGEEPGVISEEHIWRRGEEKEEEELGDADARNVGTCGLVPRGNAVEEREDEDPEEGCCHDGCAPSQMQGCRQLSRGRGGGGGGGGGGGSKETLRAAGCGREEAVDVASSGASETSRLGRQVGQEDQGELPPRPLSLSPAAPRNPPHPHHFAHLKSFVHDRPQAYSSRLQAAQLGNIEKLQGCSDRSALEPLLHVAPASSRAATTRYASVEAPDRRNSVSSASTATATMAASRSHPRSGMAAQFRGRPATAAAAVVPESSLDTTGPGGGGGGGVGSGLTAADLERLRAAEVRKRRQADEQARRLAAELASQMEHLAVLHCRRALLKWYGLMPWLQWVAAVRHEAAQADGHMAAGLMRRALTALMRGVVLVRVRTVSRVAAAVAVGRSRRQERMLRAIVRSLAVHTRAAALHRRHCLVRVLFGLMREARAGWAARADAAEHWQRRRLWSCFHGWQEAAERQASEQLLWELQRHHEVVTVLSRRTARRVLSEWWRLGREAVEQRAALQARSQQWAKVQGWLAEVHSNRRRCEVTAVVADALHSSESALPLHGQNTNVAATDEESCGVQLDVRAWGNAGEIVVASRGGMAGSSGGACQHRRGSDVDDDDPLGLGPLGEHLQQFTLGSSGLGLQAPGARWECESWASGYTGPRRRAWPSSNTGGPRLSGNGRGIGVPPLAPPSDVAVGCEMQRWAMRRDAAHQPVGPPALSSRHERLARYLQDRSACAGGAQPLGI